MKVGIIDSGVGAAHLPRLLAGQAFLLEGEHLVAQPLAADQLGHGELVTRILLEEAPQAELLVAQVFGRRGVTTAAQVAAALHWLLEQGAMLINCSLGLHADRPALRSACQQVREQGVLLCAASPAMGDAVYPASYPGMLAVTGDARCRPGEWSWLHGHVAQFGAPVGAGTAGGASMACARFTGMLTAYWSTHPELSGQQVVDYFQRQASRIGPQHREPV